MKKFITGIIIGLSLCAITVQAYAFCNAKNIFINNSPWSTNNLASALDKLYAKYCQGLTSDSISQRLQVGDVIKVTPTITKYEISSADTGCVEGAVDTLTGESACNGINGEPQIINPSKSELWRVIRINEDNTIDAIIENTAGTEVSIYGKTGYINMVGTLNKIAKQYQSPIIESSRIFGYNGQTEIITDTSMIDSPIMPWGLGLIDTIDASVDDVNMSEDEHVGYGDFLFINDYLNFLMDERLSEWSESLETMPFIPSRLYTAAENNWLFGPYPISGEEFLYGNIDGEFVNSTITHAIMPIITLKAQATVSDGEGTKDNPYIIGTTSVTINNGTGYTNNNNITLNMISSSAETMCISFTDTCTNYEPFTNKKRIEIDSTEGKTTDIYVTLRDVSGENFYKVKRSVTLDTEGPKNSSINVLDGEKIKEITTYSEGADKMCFTTKSSNVNNCRNWVDYDTTGYVELEYEKDVQTVYGFFKDLAGNVEQVQATTSWEKNTPIIYENFSDDTLDSNLTIGNEENSSPWKVSKGKYISTTQTSESILPSVSMISFTTTKESVLSFDFGTEGLSLYGAAMAVLIDSSGNQTTLFETSDISVNNKTKIRDIVLNANETYTIGLVYLTFINTPIFNGNAYIDNLIVTSSP